MSLKPNKRVFILAAGTATRFNGCIKQLLPINGEATIFCSKCGHMIYEYEPMHYENLCTGGFTNVFM